MAEKSLTREINLYSIIVVLLPIISVYASGIPGFTAGDIILLIVSSCYFLNMIIRKDRWKIGIPKATSPMLYFMSAIILTTMIDLLMVNGLSLTDITSRVVRREFYYFTTVIISGGYFQYKQSAELIIKVGIFAALYLGLQYVLYYGLNIVLTGYIPFLPVYHESYSVVDYVGLFQQQYRPTSILLEPAHASRYMCIPLTILLFEDRWAIKKRYLLSIILSFAVIMTTAGTGIIYVAIAWILLVAKKTGTAVRSGAIRVTYIAGAVVLLLLVPIILQNSTVQGAIARITATDLTNVNTAGGARFRGFIQYFKLPAINKITGMGYGNTPKTVLVTWFSGASYILYGCGIVGFVTCMYCFLKLFVRLKNATGRVLLVIWVLMFFMDDAFMSHVSVTYFSFICLSNKCEISTYRLE